MRRPSAFSDKLLQFFKLHHCLKRSCPNIPLRGAGSSPSTGLTAPQTGARHAPQHDGRIQVFGSGGLTLFGEEDEKPAGGIGVNVNFWLANLDMISFMPLLSADPFGAVNITDGSVRKT